MSLVHRCDGCSRFEETAPPVFPTHGSAVDNIPRIPEGWFVVRVDHHYATFCSPECIDDNIAKVLAQWNVGEIGKVAKP